MMAYGLKTCWAQTYWNLTKIPSRNITNANLAKNYNQNITKYFIPKETRKPKQVVQNMVNDTIETWTM